MVHLQSNGSRRLPSHVHSFFQPILEVVSGLREQFACKSRDNDHLVVTTAMKHSKTEVFFPFPLGLNGRAHAVKCAHYDSVYVNLISSFCIKFKLNKCFFFRRTFVGFLFLRFVRPFKR